MGPVSRNLEEARRLMIPLRVISQELAWEEKHNDRTNMDNPEAYRSFGVLWKALGDRSGLFRDDVALAAELCEGKLAGRILQSRHAVMEKLGLVGGLLTGGGRDGTIRNRIVKACELATALCARDVPSLIEMLEAATE